MREYRIHTNSPSIGETPKSHENVVSKDVFFFVGVGIEKIERNRRGGVKVNRVFDAMLGNVVNEFVYQVSVRVDDADAFALVDVLERHPVNQRRFSMLGFSGNVDV